MVISRTLPPLFPFLFLFPFLSFYSFPSLLSSISLLFVSLPGLALSSFYLPPEDPLRGTDSVPASNTQADGRDPRPIYCAPVPKATTAGSTATNRAETPRLRGRPTSTRQDPGHWTGCWTGHWTGAAAHHCRPRIPHAPWPQRSHRPRERSIAANTGAPYCYSAGGSTCSSTYSAHRGPVPLYPRWPRSRAPHLTARAAAAKPQFLSPLHPPRSQHFFSSSSTRRSSSCLCLHASLSAREATSAPLVSHRHDARVSPYAERQPQHPQRLPRQQPSPQHAAQPAQ